MKIPAKVSAYLTKRRVPHDVVEHKTVFTAYDLGQTLKTRLEDIAKTLLIKADRTYHLVVLRASDRLDLGKLKRLLGAKQVSIAKEGDMARELKVKPGALTPFGGLHKLPVVIDRGLTRTKAALFGSGSFQHAIRMKVQHFLKSEQPTVGAFSQPGDLKLQVKPQPRARAR